MGIANETPVQVAKQRDVMIEFYQMLQRLLPIYAAINTYCSSTTREHLIECFAVLSALYRHKHILLTGCRGQAFSTPASGVQFVQVFLK